MNARSKIFITLIIRVVMSLDPATVDLLTPLKQFGETCGYEACPAIKEGMLNVHIVPHTHGELGYTGTFHEHYTGYDNFYAKSDINMKRILDFTITELWSKSYRKFTLADMPYFFHWWSQRDGTVRRMVYQLLRQGRLFLVGGGWGMNDEACTSYHAIIESYTYSLRKLNATFMECGRPLVAWQADVFGHSREFTSLAAQMGYDGLFVNPISLDDEITRMTRQAMEFLWRGSDDLGAETDMFTHKLFDGYWAPPGFCFSSMCPDPLILSSDTVLSNAEERVDAFLESIRYRQAPNYNTSHIMVMMGQVFGYFDASVWFTNIDKLINLVNEKTYRLRKNIHLTYSTPACYLKAVHEANPVLETKQDDLFPLAPDRFSYMSGMYTSYPDVKLLAREGLVYLQMSKQMQVLARLFNNDKVFEEFLWIMGFGRGPPVQFTWVDHGHFFVPVVHLSPPRWTTGKKKCPWSTFKISVLWDGIGAYAALRHLHTLGITDSPLCKACLAEEETPSHVLLQCQGVEEQRAQILGNPGSLLEACGNFRCLWGFWEELGVFQDHNIITGAMRDYVKSYYVEKMFHAIQKSTLLLKQAFNKLRNCPTGTIYYRCSFNVSSCNNIGTSVFIHLYNPLAWNVTIPVRLPVINSQYVIYDPTGNFVTTALIKIPEHVLSIPLRDTVADHELVFLAEDIPPLGYRTYYLEELFRKKRSIIKKLKKKTKKYFRQTNTKNTDDQMPHDNSDYAYFDDDDDDEIITSTEPETKIIFGNVSKNNEGTDNSDVVTPTIQTKIIFGNVTNSKILDDGAIVTPNSKQYDEIGNENNNIESTTSQTAVSDEIADVDRDIQISTTGSTEKYESTTEVEIVTRTEATETKPTDNITAFEEKEKTERRFFDYSSQFDKERKMIENERLDLNKTLENSIGLSDRYKSVVIVDYGNVTERNEGVTRTTEKMKFAPLKKDFYVPSVEKEKETKDFRKLSKEWSSFIENKYVKINLDPTSQKISNVILSNGVNMSLDIQFYYYASDVPKKMDRAHMRDPGVYIFRSIDNKPVPIIDYLDTQVFKNDVVEELHTSYSDYASIAVRLYAEKPVIEVEWLVGPVPVDDEIGKEVFIRYMTDLESGGAFYTDSNGRQTIKRMRNLRPMYDMINNDQVAGNYYPVTSKIYIEDKEKNIRFSVFNDRSQGGTSLYDGEIDLMLQRRILTTDCSVETPVNETHDGTGIMIRGKHYLYLSKADYKPNKMFEKKFAKEIELRPQIFVSQEKPYGELSKEEWVKHRNEFSFLKSKLPVGVHILTLEQWNDGTILLRLENFFEKSDTIKSGKKTVFIKNLFTNIIINSVKETTLAANMWLENYVPPQWNKKDKFVRNFNEFYASYKKAVYAEDDDLKPFDEVDINAGITLIPQQIRTFVCTFEYIESD